jgi:hypothetical protein
VSWLFDLQLIRLFNFYLAAFFVISLVIRFRQYLAIIRLVRAVPERWPRLLQLIRQHAHVFLTWGTVFPLIVSFLLFAIQMVASTWLWPEANLTLGRLVLHWTAGLAVLVCSAGMIAFDVYWSLSVAEVDRVEIEKYFDQAEYWLRSWTAPVVKFFTLGYINPRQMVAIEVRAALVSASNMLNTTLWWMAIQAGLRIATGLALWGSWHWLHPTP